MLMDNLNKGGCNYMGMKCVSTEKKEFVDKKTGKVKEYYKVYVLDKNGGVGYIFHRSFIEPGKELKIDFVAGHDGRLRLIIADS